MRAGVDTDGRDGSERVAHRGKAPSYPDGALVDPSVFGTSPALHGRRVSVSRTFIIVKRLVLGVAALNVLVLGMLLVVTLTTGGDESPDVSVDQGDVSGRPDVTAPASEETIAAEVADRSEVAESPGPSADTAADAAAPLEPTGDVQATSAEPPPFPDPFEPAPNEVQAEAKRLGAMAAYVITNYEVDSSLTEVLATLPGDPARAEALALEVHTVHQPGMWSRGTVEYAQLGGHLDGRISIMVVVRQEVGVEGSGEPERTETRTVDVRLMRGESGAWEFEEIASAGGQPVERPADLAPLAASVVDNPRIDLPDSAIWDIYSGHTDHVLLETMLDLAERTSYSVVVLHTGHPHHVFGTTRLSNHTVGRAVDIYMVGSELVIDAHDVTSSTYALSEWLVSRSDLKEFGSPWRFDDAVAHTFTNQVHHDHLHIGVFPLPRAEE